MNKNDFVLISVMLYINSKKTKVKTKWKQTTMKTPKLENVIYLAFGLLAICDLSAWSLCKIKVFIITLARTTCVFYKGPQVSLRSFLTFSH